MKKSYLEGLKAGIPIALGYVSVSFTFGIIAITYGLNWWQATIISMLTLTSAGQFAGVGIMVVPGQYITMLISQLTINIRYSFMSVSLSQKVSKKFSGLSRWILGFFMTDEIFAVASTQNVVRRAYFAGLSTLPWFGWALGTLSGALLGNVLPTRVLSALSVAIYGMFVAIVVPEMKKSRPVIYVVTIAFALSCAFKYVPYLNCVSSGLSISFCAIIAAVLGAVFWPVDEECCEDIKEGDLDGR